MAEQITIHVKDDYIWTLCDGVLTGWKIQESGVPARMVDWERNKALREARRD